MRLEIETDKAVYEVLFGRIQIEITGRCNMKCRHCRASSQVGKDMDIGQIAKIAGFAKQYGENDMEVVVSGGEPMKHREFDKVLKTLREVGCESLTLTTNGSLLQRHHLDLFESLACQRFILSVSLDSLDMKKHDEFRGYKGAFNRATQSLKMAADNKFPGLLLSIRTVILPDGIGQMEAMVRFARDIGCDRIGFSDVHPFGRASKNRKLLMDKNLKRDFAKEVLRLARAYPDMIVSNSDPIKCLTLDTENNDPTDPQDEVVYNGCGAGVVTFNVNSNGIMTPCVLLEIPMMNVFHLSSEQIAEKYASNEVVKNMLEMNLHGKCGLCKKKYQCGGCRARAYAMTGDYLGEDPHCWV